MRCYNQIVIVLGSLIVSTQQFLFPDWTRKLSPRFRQHNNTVQTRLSPSNHHSNTLHTRPSCAGAQTFCSDPAGYPARNIAKALHRQKDSISSMFDNNLSLQARAGLDTVTHMENICSMTTKHIMPKAAKNKKGEFKFLVNGGAGTEEYIQLVQISQCNRAGEVCGNGNVFPREVTECRQEFSDHKLVALDEAGKELVIDTFSFPSCCSCYMHVGLEI